MSGPLHLARRFLGSLSPRPVDPDDERWVREHLSAGEVDLWDRMPRADRKHAAGVARDVDRRLAGAERAVLAAALLHDVGKIDSGLGTVGRAVATVVGAVVDRARLEEWRRAPGLRGRIGRYRHHDGIGAGLLEGAGSADTTVTWAREHHLPANRWTLPDEIAAALAAADDD